MTYQVDRTAQLENAVAQGRFGSVSSLRDKNTPTRQHNVVAKVEKPAKKTAKKTASKAKTSAKKKPAPKTKKS